MNGIDIIKKLHKHGHEAYIVGGYVRDFFTLGGEKSDDMDIVTSAKPEEISKLFDNYKVCYVGKSFALSYVNNIEVATYRKDVYFGKGDKDVEITFADTLQEDTARRDFTVNSLALDINTGKILDYQNGIEDLNKKIIRFVGDPEKRIWEDKNRIIRACRFVAAIEGDFDPDTFQALKKYSGYVKKYVDPNRIRIEILKAMKIEKASSFFTSMYNIGILKYIFPELHNCYDHEHGPFHDEDIFQHSMICGDGLSTKNKLLKLTGYLHDVGKPIACKIDQKSNHMYFRGHEKVGSDILKNRLIKKLKFSCYETKYITNLIKHHMRVKTGKIKPKTIRKLLTDLRKDEVNYEDLIALLIVDRIANLKREPFTDEEIKDLISRFEKELEFEKEGKSFTKLVIDGHYVMKITELKPSPEIGKILDYLMEKVINNPELNNKDDLTKLIMEKISNERQTVLR